MTTSGLSNLNFGDTVSTLGGRVYRDDNDDGAKQSGEPGLSGVQVTLTGTDTNGNPVNRTTTTDASGVYTFTDLLSRHLYRD